jgi:hypothetical protein
MEDEISGMCIEEMHTAFFIILFKKGLIKSVHRKNPKPVHDTYKPENE